jgi:hypothetical protein
MKKQIETELNFNFAQFLAARKDALLVTVSLSLNELSRDDGLKDFLSLLCTTYNTLESTEHLSYTSMLTSRISMMLTEKNTNNLHTHAVIIAFYLLDSLIKHLPNFFVRFSISQAICIYLRNLKAYVRIPQQDTIKISYSNNNLVILFDQGRKKIERDLNRYRNNRHFDLISQPTSNLSCSQWSQVDTHVDIIAFERIISKALLNISAVDGELNKNILQLIDTVIPIKLPDNIPRKDRLEYSVSFSEEKNIGTIFVSFMTNDIWLSETIVHEFAHNLLNVLMLSNNLIENKKSVFYSPWKEKPRPAHGLLHALFSFSYAANFMGNLLSFADSPSQKFIENRLIMHVHRLKFAFDEPLEESLTDEGKKVYHIIKSYFSSSSISKFLDLPCPEKLVAHKKKIMGLKEELNPSK